MTDEQHGLAWRAYWPMAVLAVTFLAVFLLLIASLNDRQHAANDRAEKQRRAICAILANIPGHIPPEIVRARMVFARPGHPGDCQSAARPTTKRTPAPKQTPSPTPTATVVITRELAQPAATGTVTPRPTATRSPRPSPTPKPSPSVCLVGVCVPSPTPLEARDRQGRGSDDVTPAPTAT